MPSTSLSSASRTLTVSGPALPSESGDSSLTPVRLRGRESVCELFAYVLELKTPEAVGEVSGPGADLDLSERVGREITLSIQLEGQGHYTPGATGDTEANRGAGVRQISALVSEARYLREEGRHHVYGLTLRPWLWLATLTRDCKIFQDMSVVQLLDQLLADYPFPVDQRLDAGAYPVRDYQVQYNETDYAFFARLCEEWGIAWWFEHADGKHQLVLADQAGAWQETESEAYRALTYYPPGHKIDEEHLNVFSLDDRLVTGVWASSDVDYTRRRADLSGAYADPRPTGWAGQEVFHW
ncbi:phage late control D family protein, partial [Azonexus sp.]|uniref:type VI secretion system Vgr family protein n=1 Tax=Azonexus sp. TaxID=1872668 RepID=UPI00281CEDB2